MCSTHLLVWPKLCDIFCYIILNVHHLLLHSMYLSCYFYIVFTLFLCVYFPTVVNPDVVRKYNTTDLLFCMNNKA